MQFNVYSIQSVSNASFFISGPQNHGTTGANEKTGGEILMRIQNLVPGHIRTVQSTDLVI